MKEIISAEQDDLDDELADDFLAHNDSSYLDKDKPIRKKSAVKEKEKGKEIEENPEELLQLYQTDKSLQLRNRIVMLYSSIAKTVAYQMRGVFSDYAQMEDIVNQGILALIECVERFDPLKQAKFQTFAYMRVRGAVIDFVRKQDWVPRRVRVTAKNINKAHDELCTELMREPTMEEIADRLDMTTELLNKYYSEISGAVTLSFESSIQGMNYSDDNPDEPIDIGSAADSGLYRQELKTVIIQSIQSLSEREQQVITLYYYEELKQSEIAQVLSVSEQRVSQLITKAIQKIRFKIEDYMQD